MSAIERFHYKYIYLFRITLFEIKSRPVYVVSIWCTFCPRNRSKGRGRILSHLKSKVGQSMWFQFNVLSVQEIYPKCRGQILSHQLPCNGFIGSVISWPLATFYLWLACLAPPFNGLSKKPVIPGIYIATHYCIFWLNSWQLD